VEGVEIFQGAGDPAGAKDLEKIRARVELLTEEEWQNRTLGLARGGDVPWGKARFARDSVHTRIHQGACIFHNRPDHPAGVGCALHLAALRRGEDPIDWKPRTCWQVPLFFEPDHERKTTVVRAARTVDWGGEGVIDWWCTEHPDAFTADRPVYATMERELRRVCGDAVYDELVAYCRARRDDEPRPPVLLPMAP
jgi:hypothetical protein